MKPKYFLLMLLSIIAPLVRCGDAPTQPPTFLPTPIPTQTVPTPIPTPTTFDLNGAWTGTLTYGQYLPSSCPPESIRVQLNHGELSQGENRISGHFATSCAGTLSIRGTLFYQGAPGTQFPLHVELWRGDQRIPGLRLVGSASSTEIVVVGGSTGNQTTLQLSR